MMLVMRAIGPGTLRPSTPSDTPIWNVCRRFSEVKKLQATIVIATIPPPK
jgi:hypothetical protein